jgi:cellulose synthase A
MKGLDGIQGPMYVGTGCCFNRQALYGYDPVLSEADLEPNIIVKSCCGGRKKKTKNYMDNKNLMIKKTESSAPIFNVKDIEEGIEGTCFVLFDLAYIFGIWKQSTVYILHH